MQDLVLKFVEVAPEPNRAWTAELWSGWPGTPGASQELAGGARFTQAQLEAAGRALVVFRAYLVEHPRCDPDVTVAQRERAAAPVLLETNEIAALIFRDEQIDE
jgi:hypothetical protein